MWFTNWQHVLNLNPKYKFALFLYALFYEGILQEAQFTTNVERKLELLKI